MTSEQKSPPPVRHDRIEWFTVRYRSVLIAGAVLVVVTAIAGWALFGRGEPEAPPLPESVETGARFTAVEGSVQVKHAGTLEWVDATTAVVLRRNDLVRTGAGATAEILFVGGDQISLRPDSLTTIEESSQNPVSRQYRVALSIQSGEANFRTAARTVPGETTIVTPTVRTTAERDTVGNIIVAEDGDTGIRIFQGGGRAETTAGQQIQLASNEGLQVGADGTAGPKTALPTVPALVAPPEGSALSYQDPSQAITLLLWNPVAGASSYRVMVDYGRTFARPLEDRQGFEGNPAGAARTRHRHVPLEGRRGGRRRHRGAVHGDVQLRREEGPPGGDQASPALGGDARAARKHSSRPRPDRAGSDADPERAADRRPGRRLLQRVRHVRGRRRHHCRGALHRGERCGDRAATPGRGVQLRSP